jgi:hypothetical protein
MKHPSYKFNEGALIDELRHYIDSTYGHGLGFFLGNVDKYNARYGKKGTPDDHRKDLMKVLHYGLLALYEHDRSNSK